MTESPKNKAIFDIAGRFVRELKIALQSENVRENEDYQDSKFDQARRLEGRHLFRFYKVERAEEAKRVWDKHLSDRTTAQ